MSEQLDRIEAKLDAVLGRKPIFVIKLPEGDWTAEQIRGFASTLAEFTEHMHAEFIVMPPGVDVKCGHDHAENEPCEGHL